MKSLKTVLLLAIALPLIAGCASSPESGSNEYNRSELLKTAGEIENEEIDSEEPDEPKQAKEKPQQVAAAANPGTSISQSKLKNIRYGLFEVVIKKHRDNHVTYERELPYEKLPYAFRTDEYFSIGTAFAVSKKTLVSAAHVFALHTESLLADKFYVRNVDGKVFELNKVTRYSQDRDLISFTLKSYPKKLKPLKVRFKSKVDQKVFSAGNALGQGIVVRGGTIASYTKEERDGKWDYIRFTAPASPGNSGGPLLNSKGKVIGVITKKSSNENLNYAVPIKLIRKTSRKSASFFIAGALNFKDSNKSTNKDWSFQVKLPALPEELSTQASTNYLQQLENTRKEFEEKYRKDLFPNSENVKIWSRNQSVYDHLTFIDSNASNVWGTRANKLKTIQMDQGQSIEVGVDKDSGLIEFRLTKPESVTLQQMYDQPKMVIDSLLKAIPINREMAGEKIRTLSYGEPVETEWHTDGYGRPWLFSHWHLKEQDTFLTTFCLPYPGGLDCLFRSGSYKVKNLLGYVDKLNLQRALLSYRGSYGEWKEFLKLPKKYLPNMMRKNAKIKLSKKGTLAYRFGNFKGRFKSKNLDQDSAIIVGIELDSETVQSLVYSSISLIPNVRERSYFIVSMIEEPHEKSGREDKKDWSDLVKKKHPFNGKIHKSGDSNRLIVVKSNRSKRSPASAGEPSRVMHYLCSSEASDNTRKFKQDCKAFIKYSRHGDFR